MVLVRRLFLLVSIVGMAAITLAWWQRRDRTNHEVPEWPAFADTASRPAWVEPVDGTCPVAHPVKLNASSGIFHLPGGRFYERTTPDRCYASADDALADGYRAAKV